MCKTLFLFKQKNLIFFFPKKEKITNFKNKKISKILKYFLKTKRNKNTQKCTSLLKMCLKSNRNISWCSMLL